MGTYNNTDSLTAAAIEANAALELRFKGSDMARITEVGASLNNAISNETTNRLRSLAGVLAGAPSYVSASVSSDEQPTNGLTGKRAVPSIGINWRP